MSIPLLSDILKFAQKVTLSVVCHPSGGVNPEGPRNVSAGEQALAEKIANQLSYYADLDSAQFAAEHEQSDLPTNVRVAAERYRTIVTTMPAAIASSGLHTIDLMPQLHDAFGVIKLASLFETAGHLALCLIDPVANV